MDTHLGDGSITVSLGGNRQVSVNAVHVMNSLCIHCHGAVNHHAYALGFPYCGLLHVGCAPYYNFNETWPHSQPAVAYMTPSPPSATVIPSTTTPTHRTSSFAPLRLQ